MDLFEIFSSFFDFDQSCKKIKIKYSYLFDCFILNTYICTPIIAGMVKLVDMPDLGSGAARREGSSPFTRTYYL